MKVLFITLSNIGDAVLTTPALSAILENYKDVEITLMVSPRVVDLFKGDPIFNKVVVYRKDSSLGRKMALIKTLRGEDFDLLVDFKDTMLPFLLYAKKKMPILKKAPKYITHMKDRHLWKLKQALTDIPDKTYSPLLYVSEEIMSEAELMLKNHGVALTDKVIAVSPGARSHTKQWTKEGFLEVCNRCYSELGFKVVLIGDQQDAKVCSYIANQASANIVNLCAKTTLKQLAALLKRSSLLVTNDSAPMHMAWAVSVPVVAIFGPTNLDKYKPTGPKDIVVRHKIDCSACQRALCAGNHECMRGILADDVFGAVRKALSA